MCFIVIANARERIILKSVKQSMSTVYSKQTGLNTAYQSLAEYSKN